MNAVLNDLSSNVAAFCAVLRTEHHVAVGHAEAHDALRALETVGVSDESRVRSALRIVCCGSHADTLVFDRAFDAFFRRAAQGAAHPAYAPRHTRPSREKPPGDRGRPSERPAAPPTQGAEGEHGGKIAERKIADGEPSAATAWQTLRARYSPLAAQARPPRVSARDFEPMLAAASRVR